MAVIRLTKEFRFEMSHMLEGYDGLCKNLHGHSYRLFVTIIGEPINDPTNPKDGMVMDFGDLKRIVGSKVVNVFDHALVIRDSKNLEVLKQINEKTVVVPFQPTCENMLPYIADEIRKELPNRVNLFQLKLYETANSFAEWYASDNTDS
ncbi:MAG: 6-carboxytetrahydropterin synthase [Bacteroidales bacterium]|nr:6-carboxytetrahydropterin synthase [Bacteroidales bacterium]MBN2749992.1 6-carboxytetrahydropterin synthase [Bacteroidales bacterium]